MPSTNLWLDFILFYSHFFLYLSLTSFNACTLVESGPISRGSLIGQKLLLESAEVSVNGSGQ